MRKGKKYNENIYMSAPRIHSGIKKSVSRVFDGVIDFVSTTPFAPALSIINNINAIRKSALTMYNKDLVKGMNALVKLHASVFRKLLFIIDCIHFARILGNPSECDDIKPDKARACKTTELSVICNLDTSTIGFQLKRISTFIEESNPTSTLSNANVDILLEEFKDIIEDFTEQVTITDTLLTQYIALLGSVVNPNQQDEMTKRAYLNQIMTQKSYKNLEISDGTITDLKKIDNGFLADTPDFVRVLFNVARTIQDTTFDTNLEELERKKAICKEAKANAKVLAPGFLTSALGFGKKGGKTRTNRKRKQQRKTKRRKSR